MDVEISHNSYKDMLHGHNDINLDHECHKLLSWRRVIRFFRACAVGDSILQTSEITNIESFFPCPGQAKQVWRSAKSNYS